MGALIYPKINKKISDTIILHASNIIVALIAMLGPKVIASLDPLASDNTLGLTILCYFPIVLLGVLTGFEIPALFSILSDNTNSRLQKKQSFALGFDYLGMVAASFIYPSLLIYFGVFQLSYVSLGICLVTGIFLLSIKARKKNTTVGSVESHLSWETFLIAVITYLVSFCSLSYELIFAKIFTDILSNEVYAHAITIGFYLLGLGFGALTLSAKRKSDLKSLANTEMILIVSALLSLPILYLSFTLWKLWLYRYVSKISMLIILEFVTLWIGFWSGRELPLCMNIMSEKVKNNQSFALSLNYFGALLAGFLVPIYLLTQVGVRGGIFLIAFINLLVLLAIYYIYPGFKKGIWQTIVLLPVIGLFLIIPRLNQWSEQVHLKTYYHRLILPQVNVSSLINTHKTLNNLDDVVRIETPYQYIDLVRTQLPLSGGALGTLTLYLNKQPQFSLDSWKLYHDSFSFGAINLHKKTPKNILILGGGDGLLASQLVKLDGIENIKMIELDHKVVEFSTQHHEISKANNHVFKNKKVKVIYDDAYSWLKKHKESFDGIFIDFPYPTSFELSRLYSLEFYSLIYNHLNDDGFVVLDAPISFLVEGENEKDMLRNITLMETIKSSGFNGVFPFGVVEPFIYAEKKNREFKFSYESLKFLENRSFVNLLGISGWFPDEKEKVRINSLFHPSFLEADL